MTKFEITEAQIDNYNDTNNQLSKFDGELNIICGENEVGKSTLMDFIKNILIRKTNAKGYIKCRAGEESFSIRAEKTKIKENEKFLEKINPYGYKTGFIINLDDIMFSKKADSEELINVIKDSSGNAVNTKQEDYYNFIYGKKQRFQLTPKNSETVGFKKQFEKLKELNLKISELQSKEEEYNNICISLDVLLKELNRLSSKKECTDLILKIKDIKNEIAAIKINKKLLSHRDEFDNLREELGALNSSVEKVQSVKNSIEHNQKFLDEKYSELNRIEPFDDKNITNFGLSDNSLSQAKEYIEQLKNYNNERQNIQNSIDEITQRIEELKFEVKATEHKIESLEIKDIKDLKADCDILESYKSHYTDIRNKLLANDTASNKNFYNKMFALLFIGTSFITLGMLVMYWNTPMKFPIISILLVSLAGINTTVMEKLSAKKNNGLVKELKTVANKIITLCKKYGYELIHDDNLGIRLGSFLNNMNDKMSEYKIIENDLLKLRMSLEKEKVNRTKKESKIQELTDAQNHLETGINNFLNSSNVKHIENYPDIYALIKEIKDTQKSIHNSEEELENINTATENFVNNLNRFINESELDIQNLNRYDYENFAKILSDIRIILDENISNKKLSDELEQKLKTLSEDINQFDENIIMESEQLNNDEFKELQALYQDKCEEKARLIQTKESLEQVETIVALKNRKNIELNQLKNGLSNLIKKEIIYNIIKSAKEQFNKKQPNLLSAKNFLSQITSGKYTEIDFETKTISGENTPEKDWDNLSRGTKEQLYLALRLGYAVNYTKDIDGNDNGIPSLPLIIDDAFVNFDYNRTVSILKCLENFAQNNQVLYFTCHSKMIKEILKSENIKHTVIEL